MHINKIFSIISCSTKLYINNILGLQSTCKYVHCRLFKRSVTLRLKPDNHPVFVRGGTSDADVFFDIFGTKFYDLPYGSEPKCIIDGGANAGYATIWYTRRFPRAEIISIEPDSCNLASIKRNTTGLVNVRIIEGAIWPKSSLLRITDPMAEKWAIRVSENGAGEGIQGYTIEDLLTISSCQAVDILKLDIEGAEEQLFAESCNCWIDRVKQIVIELHDQENHYCALNFYKAISVRKYLQKQKGENVFIQFV